MPANADKCLNLPVIAGICHTFGHESYTYEFMRDIEGQFTLIIGNSFVTIFRSKISIPSKI